MTRPEKRYFVHPPTGGRIIVKASMSPQKHRRLTQLLQDHGYQETSQAKYRRVARRGPQ